MALVGPALSHHYIVGVDVIHGAACLVKGIEQSGFAESVHGTAGALLLQESGGSQGAGIEMVLRHIQPHPCQLQLQLAGGIATVIGKKQILFLFFVQPVDKFGHTGQNDIAVVDDTVHIANKALRGIKIKLCHRFLLNYCISVFIIHNPENLSSKGFVKCPAGLCNCNLCAGMVFWKRKDG